MRSMCLADLASMRYYFALFVLVYAVLVGCSYNQKSGNVDCFQKELLEEGMLHGDMNSLTQYCNYLGGNRISVVENDSLWVKYIDLFQTFSSKEIQPNRVMKESPLNGKRISIDDFIYEYDTISTTLEIIRNNYEIAISDYKSNEWTRKYSKDDFFEWVAPYKIDIESVSDWRIMIKKDIQPILDSLRNRNVSDVLTIASEIMKFFNKQRFKWTGLFPVGPNLGIKNYYLRAGSCREFAEGVVYLMRAAGIASGIDFVIIRSDDNSPHLWPFIKDENGNTYIATTERPYWHPATDHNVLASKFYRQIFWADESIIKSTNHDNFMNGHLEDVTSVYNHHNITIKGYVKKTIKGKPIYLCQSKLLEWTPVAIGKNENSVVEFNNVNPEGVFILATNNGISTKYLSKPFRIVSKRFLSYYESNESKCNDITLFSKYPTTEYRGDLVHRCIGGVIEASNDCFFREKDTLYLIKEHPKRLINIAEISNTKSFRYYRYYGPEGTYCNIAEIMLFKSRCDTMPLKGSVFGTSGSWDNDTTHTFEKVFDGNIFTSFDYIYPSGGWAAIDLKSEYNVKKIAFVPRNRDNFIHPGDEYDLYVWKDDSWWRLGRQKAQADSVNFHEVPSGQLYYLRNITRGHYERIFEYDFNKRIQIYR